MVLYALHGGWVFAILTAFELVREELET